MIRRTFRGLVQLLGGLGAGLAIFMALVAWKLSAGPISLGFITPHIEQALARVHPDFSVRLEDTIMTWGGWNRALDIRVVNVRLLDNLQTEIATIPQLSMSLSAAALVRGVIAPKRIELFRPTLRLLRLRNGDLQVSFGPTPKEGVGDGGGEAGDLVGHLLERLMSPPDPGQAMSYLSRLEVFDGDLAFEDQGLEMSWHSPTAHLLLSRDADGIHGEVEMDLIIEGQQGHVIAVGGYRAQENRADAEIEFNGIRPALFSRLAPALLPFAAIDLPLSGTASLGVTGEGMVDWIGFDLQGGKGRLTLPSPLEQELEIEEFGFRGRFDGEDGSLMVDDLSVDFGPDGFLVMPRPSDHRMPLASMRAGGRYAADRGELEISLLQFDLQGPRLEVEGGVSGLKTPAAMEARFKGALSGVQTDQLTRYWPSSWGTDAWNWVTANLSGGHVPKAEAEAVLKGQPDGGFQLTELKGEMDIEGVSVDYLSPMPKAHGVSGRASFDMQRFDVHIDRGAINDLHLEKGTVLLTGLDQIDQFADIELFINGPVRDAMRLIDSKPLGFAEALGIRPDDTAGLAKARLKLDFILEKDLTQDRVDVVAEADLSEAMVAEAVLNRNVTEGNLKLRVDKQGLDLEGDIKLAGLPARLGWRRNFGDKAAIVSHYDLAATIEDVRRTEDLGFDLGPFADDYVSGASDITLRYTEFKGGSGRLQAGADLTRLGVDLPMIGWSKRMGDPGRAEVSLNIQNDMVSDIEHFSITSLDLAIKGRAGYSPAGTGLERVDFDRISYGRTDMRGTLTPNQDGSWTVGMHGDSFDLSPVMDNLFEEKTGNAKKTSDLRYVLSIDLKTIWTEDDRRIRDVVGTLAWSGDHWRAISLEGAAGQRKPFSLRILPSEGRDRSLEIRAEDAGEFLRSLGYYDNMMGGRLEIKGIYDDDIVGSPLEGNLVITDYRVVNAPTLAHVVSLAALTGILDTLKGDGLGFLRMEVPFSMHDGVIEIKDAKSSGVSLGFTASGRIYAGAEVVDLQGTIVPAYAINAIWGQIPILGEILTGGEKGGGIFAARYGISGSMESPSVTVDPLSALAPGILRNIFSIFDPDKKPEPELQSPPPSEIPAERSPAAPPVGGL